MRRLATTRRHVPLDVAEEYTLAWLAVARAVAAANGRAWLFRGAAHEDHFLEFIEWDDNVADPLRGDDVLAALAQLDSFAVATAEEEWEEAT